MEIWQKVLILKPEFQGLTYGQQRAPWSYLEICILCCCCIRGETWLKLVLAGTKIEKKTMVCLILPNCKIKLKGIFVEVFRDSVEE